MSKTTFEHSHATLEEKLTSYWRLVDDREQILARIAKAKNEKDSVNDRIFQKVLADYEGALQGATARLEPLKKEIDTLREQVDQDIKQLDAAIVETEDEVSEAEFRHRVGEYDGARLSEVRLRLEPRLTEARELRRELQSQLGAMERRRAEAARPVSPPKPSAENSYQWAQEIEPTAGSDEVQWEDPLAALTDPASKGSRPASPASAEGAAAQPSKRGRGATVAPAYPNLVVRSGVHAGKIVPLLPMTMSIGREHDNNIELKDPEVGRYHARILYENGRFHVEDLDSSTGTWVNGQHQRKRALSEGDVIRIGGTELVVEFA
jgi:hypothetical protein